MLRFDTSSTIVRVQHLANRFWQRSSKPLVSLFIVLTLATQVRSNLPLKAQPVGADVAPTMRQIINLYNSGVGILTRVGYLTGTNTYWRMASPVPRQQWTITALAEYPDGSVLTLPLPTQVPRTFLQDFFTDSREFKIYLNTFPNEPLLEAHVQHLCISYPHPITGDSPTGIIFNVKRQELLSQQDAARLGVHLDPIVHGDSAQAKPCRL